MLIQEMMDKRDLATNICVALQNQIGKDIAGIFEMDEFEQRTTEEFEKYVDSEMTRLDIKVMIFTGWVFTKDIFEKQYEYYNSCLNSDRYILYLPEINTIIAAIDKDTMIENVVKKIKLEIKKVSDLNIENIIESDNGIQIDYFSNSKVLLFEERPKIIEEIIKENNDNIA